jgi:integrase
MATFTIVLDKRVKKKGNKYNLSLRIVDVNKVSYVIILKMTEQQYQAVFIKKARDEESIRFRETCNGYVAKAERIFSGMRTFEPKKFRELLFAKEVEVPDDQLLLKDLFKYFLENYHNIKYNTRIHYRKSGQVLENYKPGLTIWDITPAFLKQYEKDKLKAGNSQSTIDSYIRDLRSIINYCINEKKIIPRTYEYPFGRGGYSVKSFWPKKDVMTDDEIKQVVEFDDFDEPAQKYARDLWLFLYRCNGINFVDALRMRWSDIHQDKYIIFFRRKTETTRKNNKKEIVVPVNEKLAELIEKIGVKESPFVLGQIGEGYEDYTLDNRCHKLAVQMNRHLLVIQKKLNLSAPLKLETARDCYASTQKRNGVSNDVIAEMLGHSNSVVTEHYLASLDMEKTFEINSNIY